MTEKVKKKRANENDVKTSILLKEGNARGLEKYMEQYQLNRSAAINMILAKALKKEGFNNGKF